MNLDYTTPSSQGMAAGAARQGLFDLSPREWVVLLLIAALLALPVVAGALDQTYLVSQFRRILIFALAAMSLNLIMGYGGMVCFGQAAFFGLGAYVVAFLNVGATQAQHAGLWAVWSDPLVSWGLAGLAAAAAACVIGAVSLRTKGVSFIMITLAFAQMLYFIFVGMKSAGGDDGLRFRADKQLLGLVDLSNTVLFYYLVLGILLAVLWLTHRLVQARFGIVLQGARDNERRMKALGFDTYRYKLSAFVMAAALAGLAGGLFATHESFMSPSVMHWSRSGELIVMVVLGGMGTTAGPILGAMVYLTLEKFLPDVTEHWAVWFGPVLVLCVLYARKGLLGSIPALRRAPAPAPRPREARHA